MGSYTNLDSICFKQHQTYLIISKYWETFSWQKCWQDLLLCSFYFEHFIGFYIYIWPRQLKICMSGVIKLAFWLVNMDYLFFMQFSFFCVSIELHSSLFFRPHTEFYFPNSFYLAVFPKIILRFLPHLLISIES